MKTALRQVVQKVFGLGDKDIFEEDEQKYLEDIGDLAYMGFINGKSTLLRGRVFLYDLFRLKISQIHYIIKE